MSRKRIFAQRDATPYIICDKSHLLVSIFGNNNAIAIETTTERDRKFLAAANLSKFVFLPRAR